MLDNMKVEYDNELKIKCDCYFYLSGTHGCTPQHNNKHNNSKVQHCAVSQAATQSLSMLWAKNILCG